MFKNIAIKSHDSSTPGYASFYNDIVNICDEEIMILKMRLGKNIKMQGTLYIPVKALIKLCMASRRFDGCKAFYKPRNKIKRIWKNFFYGLLRRE